MSSLYVLATAVITASVMGSMHCVGMCGPLAIWASGSGDRAGKKTVATSTALYHAGRLTTYAIAGALAGLIGSLIDTGGNLVGIQVAAARFVGTAMVLIGVYKLVSVCWPASTSKVVSPSAVGKVLVKLRPYVFRLPIIWRGFATGLLTTLLPCGWLYLFALIAAGTGSPIGGAVVMSAFWLGSVPALTALVAGVRVLSQRYARMIPAAAALFLITAGLFTASGRGFAGFDGFDELASEGTLLEQVEQTDEKLPPCCRVEQQ
ncbi:sulfite exporter TauE/SafE family protein [Stieleria sp. JC731]|uniref:sulfite exporter TauE/SafE family protein n=1 Tax=Pirellulaceae TaxID=2691357 RepID=UPI001E41C511|nr:sulfite exporter TauE/SafE family protein [Stieleria sp. JC731]MCC9600599.1 sulfite exporter TauE/SafE family protein [Stieleria sp. JC731]